MHPATKRGKYGLNVGQLHCNKYGRGDTWSKRQGAVKLLGRGKDDVCVWDFKRDRTEGAVER
jgi:hypothetical protein